MVDERIGCVMIVDQGRLVGIFSERDAIMKLNTDTPKFIERPISQFMTPGPVTLETNDKIAYALHKMNVGGYRHIPILFQRKLAGVISIRDILRYLAERITARRNADPPVGLSPDSIQTNSRIRRCAGFHQSRQSGYHQHTCDEPSHKQIEIQRLVWRVLCRKAIIDIAANDDHYAIGKIAYGVVRGHVG